MLPNQNSCEHSSQGLMWISVLEGWSILTVERHCSVQIRVSEVLHSMSIKTHFVDDYHICTELIDDENFVIPLAQRILITDSRILNSRSRSLNLRAFKSKITYTFCCELPTWMHGYMFVWPPCCQQKLIWKMTLSYFLEFQTRTTQWPAASYGWTGQVWGINGWSSRLREKYGSFYRNV